jgi:serine/threonine protein kinase/tetratricopeptide (TPR) repeat protein
VLGQIVSHYDVADKLGEGGMGVVYLARDRRLHRSVVLKFLSKQLSSSPDRIARFKEEGKALSALNHPNIETIYDIADHDGEVFLVLEYLPGGTLGAVISELNEGKRNLPLDRAIQYGIDIAEGLEHAHRHGVIHRDMKTSNLMLTESGTVKITDFGLAKLAEGAHVTTTGTTMGTPSYMSPEQAEGRDVDYRSDIFSLGVVLFELITGRLPFQGASPPAVLYQIVHEPVPSINELRTGVPPGLVAIVRRALEKNPGDRYQSLGPMLTDLRRLQKTSALDTIATAPLPASKRRPWFAMAAATVVLLVVGIAWILFHQRKIMLPSEKSLVVLPFKCTPADAANQAFCDGLVDNLTSQIARLEQFHRSLSVVPSSDVRRGNVKSIDDAIHKLGATLVLTGSIDRSADVVNVSGTLADASNSRPLGSFSKPFRIADPSSMQSGVVDDVAQLLEIELTPQSRRVIEAGATPVGSAYELYLKGRGYLQAPLDTNSIDSAIEMFQQARERDPSYALAYAGIAQAFSLKYTATSDTQFLEMAEPNARHALELNDKIAEIHMTMGFIEHDRGEYPQAVAEYKRALELDPANPDTMRRLATAYEAEGDLPAAEATYQKAIKLRPTYFRTYDNLGNFLIKHGRLDSAEAPLKRAVELSPQNARGWNSLGALYLSSGRYHEAEDSFRRSLAIDATPEAYTNLAILYEYQNRYADAVPYLEKAVVLAPSNHLAWGHLAEEYRRTHQSVKAAAASDKAIELAERQLRMNKNDTLLRSRLAFYEAQAQHSDRALTEIAVALRETPLDRNVLHRAAVVYELTGRREMAFLMLEKAVKAGFSPEVIRKEPELAQLRADPRFAHLQLQ